MYAFVPANLTSVPCKRSIRSPLRLCCKTILATTTYNTAPIDACPGGTIPRHTPCHQATTVVAVANTQQHTSQPITPTFFPAWSDQRAQNRNKSSTSRNRETPARPEQYPNEKHPPLITAKHQSKPEHTNQILILQLYMFPQTDRPAG